MTVGDDRSGDGAVLMFCCCVVLLFCCCIVCLVLCLFVCFVLLFVCLFVLLFDHVFVVLLCWLVVYIGLIFSYANCLELCYSF